MNRELLKSMDTERIPIERLISLLLQIPDRESRLHGVLEPPSRSFRATFTE